MIILQFSADTDRPAGSAIEQVILFEDDMGLQEALEDCEGGTEEEKIQDLALSGLTFDKKWDTDIDLSFTSLPLGDNLVRISGY